VSLGYTSRLKQADPDRRFMVHTATGAQVVVGIF
jgi:hypothetical protein